ncbi:MAG: DUF1538 domain-containing protein [Dehalococcoidales bacterium]|nr:DUF1538 domain-containing protein [Dehalococcoidales bacterium]
MYQIIKNTAIEALGAMLPIVAIIVTLHFTVLNVESTVFLRFLAGSTMSVFGVFFFLLGARTGILPMGRDIGAELPQHNSIPLIVAVGLIFGFAVTTAEPGVMTLNNIATNAGVDNGATLIIVISAGVAVLFTTGLIRIIFGFPIKYVLAITYGIAIILAFFTPPEFLSIAFDGGGVAAGSFTVPMLLALGMGFTSVLGNRSYLSDGFGLIGLACAGPIIGLLVLGMFFF